MISQPATARQVIPLPSASPQSLDAPVDWVAQAVEMRAARFELLDDREQVADGTREAVEPDDHQGFARTDVAQQPCQHGPAAVGAGSVLLQDGVAAGCAEFVALWVSYPAPRWKPAHSPPAGRKRCFCLMEIGP